MSFVKAIYIIVKDKTFDCEFRYNVTVMILLRAEDTNTKAFNCEFQIRCFYYDHLKVTIEIRKPSHIAKFEVIMSFRYVLLLLYCCSTVKPKDYNL